jgi:hypothetical protein
MRDMNRSTRLLLLVGVPIAATAAAAAVMQRRGRDLGVHSAEGILVGDAGMYDRLAGPLLGLVPNQVVDGLRAPIVRLSVSKPQSKKGPSWPILVPA